MVNTPSLPTPPDFSYISKRNPCQERFKHPLHLPLSGSSTEPFLKKNTVKKGSSSETSLRSSNTHFKNTTSSKLNKSQLYFYKPKVRRYLGNIELCRILQGHLILQRAEPLGKLYWLILRFSKQTQNGTE